MEIRVRRVEKRLSMKIYGKFERWRQNFYPRISPGYKAFLWPAHPYSDSSRFFFQPQITFYRLPESTADARIAARLRLVASSSTAEFVALRTTP
jgi:hypothetical protein